MKLTVFNGSPRGKKSNTTILLEHFLKGFMETDVIATTSAASAAKIVYKSRV